VAGDLHWAACLSHAGTSGRLAPKSLACLYGSGTFVRLTPKPLPAGA
jgi:hypothetical protein